MLGTGWRALYEKVKKMRHNVGKNGGNAMQFVLYSRVNNETGNSALYCRL
jgi:hypothetical protein